MTEITVDILPTHPKLGRHVEHDVRSLRYLYPRTATELVDVQWNMEIPVLDQGQLGACTGFAAAGCLGHDPYYGTLSGYEQGRIDSSFGKDLYAEATTLDSIPGTWPPDDTGSTGLAVAKAVKSLGLISGYTHITSIEALVAALHDGPIIVGTNWYQSMFNYEFGEHLIVDESSGLAGGHEYVCDGMRASGYFTFTNSWGTGWGDNGKFSMQAADFAKLLDQQGDATVFVPVTQPAPTPSPAPAPQPVDGCVLAAYKQLKKWAKKNGVK